MTTTRDDLLKIFSSNVAAIQFELDLIKQRDRKLSDCVFVWPNHWLAVKLGRQDECRAVGIVHATVVSARDKRVFTNGNRERAILMDREKALCGALVHAVEILENFKEHA